jgi:hypothetical protein
MSDRADTNTGRRNGKSVVTRLRPTLFVALGGTGKEVVLRLRRRILQNDWGGGQGTSLRVSDIGRFPIASFIYFDTDTTEAIDTSRSLRNDPMARATAFKDSEKLQKRVDVRHYMDELDAHPLIREWLPEGDLASINTDKGAGQVRAISRLLFFEEFSRFTQLVRDQGKAVLNNIGRQGDLAQLSVDIEPELRVVVIASSAGGTGSGSFIDVGLAIKAIQDPKPAQVDLILLLPGGFRGNNLQRVNANSFAALMELEHVMRDGASPPYVNRWNSDAGPSSGPPYDEVYLIDTSNVTRDLTNDVTHIYDMVSDVLFEDFGSSEFSSRKRSISVNTEQFKLVNYLPPMSERNGPQSLSYSCAYSSFGQSTIVTKGLAAFDQAVVAASKSMLQSFFNVALEESGRLPSPDERETFIHSNFYLLGTSFQESLQGIEDDKAINEPVLVGELLKSQTGNAVDMDLADQVHRRYQEDILGSGDLRNWPTLALRIFEDRKDDILGRMDKQAGEYGPIGLIIRSNRQRMLRQFKSRDDDGVRAVLFRYLDNRVRGGLDYTIALVKDSKSRLEAEAADLIDVQRAYESRSELVRDRFNRSLENLKDAARPRFVVGPDRKAAERYLDQLREETAYYLKLQLRAVCAAEAAQLLMEMSEDLGTPRGVDGDGNTIWEGAIASLVQGRQQVEQVLTLLDDEVRLLSDAVGRQNAGTYIVLPDADAEAEALMKLSPAEVEGWAQSIFADEGGSRELFPKLEEPVQLAELLGKLRGFARQQLAPRAARLRSVRDILLSMDEQQRRDMLRGAMRRAMPWINARFDRLGDSVKMEDRYKLYVAVESREMFGTILANEVQQAIPGALGFRHCEIVSSGLRDRIVIYCEVSGIPLDTIIPLGDEWRRCYRAERRGPLPLHNHKSATRFANPVVPSSEEIEKTRKDMALFLRAVCFGILQRNAGIQAPYKFDLGYNDWVDIGSERDIRASGFDDSHLVGIRAAVEKFERSLAPIQVLAASVLLDWTARRAYAARKVRVGENITNRRPGLVQIVALEVANTYLTRSKQMDGSAALGPLDDATRALKDGLLSWTTEIVDSVDDIDPFDSNMDLDEDPQLRAANKRTIIADRFAPEKLQALLTTKRANGMAPIVQPHGESRWFLSIKKTLSGPFDLAQLRDMALRGQLLEGTNVRAVDDSVWTRVRHVPVLLALLQISDLPDDENDSLPADE